MLLKEESCGQVTEREERKYIRDGLFRESTVRLWRHDRPLQTRNSRSFMCADSKANGWNRWLSSSVAGTIHLGRTSQVWKIRISDDAGKLTCVSRLTMAALERPKDETQAR